MIYEEKDKYGRYLEGFQVGDVYRHWPGKTITESDNNLVCLLTMSHNPLHLDANVMSEHQHGRILRNWIWAATGLFLANVLIGVLYIFSWDSASASFEEHLSLAHLLTASLSFLALATAWIGTSTVALHEPVPETLE